jgi:hypothetical protein
VNLFKEKQEDFMLATQLIEKHAAGKPFNYPDYSLTSTDAHPNALYNRVVAEALLQWILTGADVSMIHRSQ